MKFKCIICEQGAFNHVSPETNKKTNGTVNSQPETEDGIKLIDTFIRYFLIKNNDVPCPELTRIIQEVDDFAAKIEFCDKCNMDIKKLYEYSEKLTWIDREITKIVASVCAKIIIQLSDGLGYTADEDCDEIHGIHRAVRQNIFQNYCPRVLLQNFDPKNNNNNNKFNEDDDDRFELKHEPKDETGRDDDHFDHDYTLRNDVSSTETPGQDHSQQNHQNEWSIVGVFTDKEEFIPVQGYDPNNQHQNPINNNDLSINKNEKSVPRILRKKRKLLHDDQADKLTPIKIPTIVPPTQIILDQVIVTVNDDDHHPPPDAEEVVHSSSSPKQPAPPLSASSSNNLTLFLHNGGPGYEEAECQWKLTEGGKFMEKKKGTVFYYLYEGQSYGIEKTMDDYKCQQCGILRPTTRSIMAHVRSNHHAKFDDQASHLPPVKRTSSSKTFPCRRLIDAAGDEKDASLRRAHGRPRKDPSQLKKVTKISSRVRHKVNTCGNGTFLYDSKFPFQQTSQNKFECGTCHVTKNSRLLIFRHIKKVHFGSDKPEEDDKDDLICPFCYKKTKKHRRKQFILHVKHHYKNQNSEPSSSQLPSIISCPGDRFIYKSRWIYKKDTTEGPDGRFICDVCEVAKDNVEDMWEHLTTEHKKYKKRKPRMPRPSDRVGCPSCGADHEQDDAKLEQLGLPFTRVDTCRFKCEPCGKVLKKFSYLATHYQEQHQNSSRSLTCEVCGARFTRKFSLKEHQVVHSTDAPYMCQLCGLFAKTANRLRMHMLSHENWECDRCHRKFTHKRNFQRHQKLHCSGIENCICTQCGRRFKRKDALHKHLDTCQGGHSEKKKRKHVEKEDPEESSLSGSSDDDVD